MADDAFRARLAEVEPAGRKQEPSAARARIQETFDDLTAARKRGVAWQQIAALMTADGIKAADGEPLTPDEVKALFHAERYARGERRKRRPNAGAAEAPKVRPRRVTPDVEAEPVAAKPLVPAPLPAPENARPADPYAELDRRQHEAKQRRERTAKARDWNPFDLSNKEASE
ncbi:hypothetical protein EAH89_26215 [Roseomonas nepalensis]|uniref:Uncharacterized protein n=1 Tax=Muricoccus nepalensis TaxID=1854500 RepID=A0A502F8H9_9PROT|nr:hypothetical protein [Roseomonas nepalensis]TPG45698.1 hypothetical protein EAH89_26215 [Roseomonas nepalensis]